MKETNADKQITAAINSNNYNEDELLQIKIALNAPYIQNNNNCERYDGSVEYKGVQYNYVKRLVQNDTLYLYCIPNKEKTDISNTKDSYARQNADNPASKKSGESALKKINLLNEYNSDALSFKFDAHQSVSNQIIPLNNFTTLKGFTTKHLQPPDLFI